MALDDKSEERLVWAFAGLTVLAILAWVFGFLIWDSGQLSGMLAHGRFPSSTPGDVPGVLIRIFSNLGDPAQAWPEVARKDVGPAGLLYVFLALQLAVLVAAVFLVIRFVFRFRRRRKSRRLRLGFASPGEIDRLLSASAVQKKAPSVRPSMPKARAYEVGFAIGKDSRSNKQLYGSIEDVFLIVAPPRQGKDVHFCIPYTIDAPGPVLMTSTRADAFGATVSMREKVGQVWVFDPNNMTSWPSRLRWSPVRGCEEPLRALSRASAFVAGAGVGEGVTNASYWTGVATSILRCYLHAAALANRTMADVVRWSTQPTNPEPINILRWGESQGLAAPGWAGELEQASASDSESRGNMWNGVRRALDCFADPSVLASCSPGPEESFDVQAFLAGRNTLYVLGKEKKAGSVAPLVTAMMEDIFDQARAIATRMPNSRLDPPLTVELNEAAHIAPMPNLPGYMGDSGGFSIALHVYLQSLAQARSRWSDDEAAVMWDTAAVRVVMGGSGHVNDLEDISRLIGEVDEKQRTKTRGYDGRSTSVSQQARRVLTVDELRTLEFGNAVVVARSARPVEAKLTPWWKRSDAAQIKAGQQRVSALLAEPERQTVSLPAAQPRPALPPGGVPARPVLPGYQPETAARRGLPSAGQLPQRGAVPVSQPAADEPELSVFEQVTTRLPYDGSNQRTAYPQPSEAQNLAPGWGLPVEGRAPWNAEQAQAAEEARAAQEQGTAAPHAADATVETQHPAAGRESRRPHSADATVETSQPFRPQPEQPAEPQPEQPTAEPFTALPRGAAAAETRQPDRAVDDTHVSAWVPYQVDQQPHRVEPDPEPSTGADESDEAWQRYLAEQQAVEPQAVEQEIVEPLPAAVDDETDNSDEAWQRRLAEQQARAAQPPADPWGGVQADEQPLPVEQQPEPTVPPAQVEPQPQPEPGPSSWGPVSGGAAPVSGGSPDSQVEQPAPVDAWRASAPGRVVAQPSTGNQPLGPDSWHPPVESPPEPAPDSWNAAAQSDPHGGSPDAWLPPADPQPKPAPGSWGPAPGAAVPVSGALPDPQAEEPAPVDAWRASAPGRVVGQQPGPTAQQPPLQPLPVQQPPVQPAPIEQPTAQEQPLQPLPVRQPPVQQQPVQSPPVEQQPVQQQPVQPPPVEQQPVQQQPVQPLPVEQPPAPVAEPWQPPARPEPATGPWGAAANQTAANETAAEPDGWPPAGQQTSDWGAAAAPTNQPPEPYQPAQPYRVEAQPAPQSQPPAQPYRVDPQPYQAEPPAAVQPRGAQPYRVDPQPPAPAQPYQQGAAQPTQEIPQPYWPGQPAPPQSEAPPHDQQETRPYWVGQPRNQPYRVEQVDPTGQHNPVRQQPPADPYVQPPPAAERRSAAPYLADQRVVPAPQYPASQQEQVAPLHPANQPPADEQPEQ